MTWSVCFTGATARPQLFLFWCEHNCQQQGGIQVHWDSFWILGLSSCISSRPQGLCECHPWQLREPCSQQWVLWNEPLSLANLHPLQPLQLPTPKQVSTCILQAHRASASKLHTAGAVCLLPLHWTGLTQLSLLTAIISPTTLGMQWLLPAPGPRRSAGWSPLNMLITFSRTRLQATFLPLPSWNTKHQLEIWWIVFCFPLPFTCTQKQSH